jgi:hypothetical protein
VVLAVAVFLRRKRRATLELARGMGGRRNWMDLDSVVGRDKAVHLIRCPQSFSPVLKLFLSFDSECLYFFIMEGVLGCCCGYLRFRYGVNIL